MNPNKAGLVVAAVAAQWVLAQAPVPLVSTNTRSRIEPGHSMPKPSPGTKARTEGGHPLPVAAHLGPLALNR
ncbi:hypothetical protein [Ideonella sp. YS5]|uniref:hypothetical protein n=1 Tax=Ideonella sp. YS5 TaxID=3453714 RepID=UPI003EEBB0C9